ncbi:MAG: hypothetical protein NTZ46_11430 [Verrucomicrobia bacterium]|nr:hypothetical protein [Verrucomicrobiota bacterium]
MTTRHSESLILVWRVAAVEARNLNSPVIEPTHLLLGLCKVVDFDLPKVANKISPASDDLLEELFKETRRLRRVFAAVNLDAKQFRRSLRAKLHMNLALRAPETKRYHRSESAKAVFRNAERWAELTESPVFPIHLLYAIMEEDDDSREQVLVELRLDGKGLERESKHEALFGCGRNPRAGDNPRHNQLN